MKDELMRLFMLVLSVNVSGVFGIGFGEVLTGLVTHWFTADFIEDFPPSTGAGDKPLHTAIDNN